MSNGFNNIRPTASEAAVKIVLVQGLAQFVECGLDRVGQSKKGVRIAPVVNAIIATLADSMVHGRYEHKATPEALIERVLSAYLDEYDASCKRYLKELVTPVVVTGWRAELDAIVARYGARPERRPITPSVADALDVAWDNLRRAQQRYVAWFCLGSMFHNTATGRQHDSAEAGDLETTAQELWAEERIMKHRVLMLALMLGGTAADQVKDWLKRTSFSSDMSIMEYLAVDGQMPCSWRTADEEAFRAALAAA